MDISLQDLFDYPSSPSTLDPDWHKFEPHNVDRAPTAAEPGLDFFWRGGISNCDGLVSIYELIHTAFQELDSD